MTNSREEMSATRADVLKCIYDRMLAGASFAEANREANAHFGTGYNREIQAAVAGTGNAPTPEPVSDTTDDSVVPCTVSRFEMIEIEGIEGRSKKKEGNDGENGSNRF